MSNDEKMTVDERRKYLRKMKPRYIRADRKMKGILLDEMEAVLGLDRKTLIRLMNGSLERKPRRNQRSATYGPEVDDALRVIHESVDYICAERLTPNLVWLAGHLAPHGELSVSPHVLEQLGRISSATVERRLNRINQDQPRLPRPKPKPRQKLLQRIPAVRLSWTIVDPGHFETDLVHHCGPSAGGEYACTLQMIDVATGWSERRAVLGRSFLVMEDAFLSILDRLPFPIRQIHPDNGSEFFNQHMLRLWGQLVQNVTISRSRPWHKNDNPRVEQKNHTLVRAYLGQERIDSVAQVLALNTLYNKMWRYYNLFQPVMHLVAKETIQQDDQPARVKRHHDDARTPFDRLCDTDAILPEHQAQLQAMRNSINPRRLRQEIYHDIEHLFTLPAATPGVAENVHQTLAKNQEIGDDHAFKFAFNCTPIRYKT